MQSNKCNFCNSSPGLSNGHLARFAAECRKMLAQRRTPGGLAPPLGPQSKIPATNFSAFPSRTRRRSPRCCTRCLLVAVSIFARDLYLVKFWPPACRQLRWALFALVPSLDATPAAQTNGGLKVWGCFVGGPRRPFVEDGCSAPTSGRQVSILCFPRAPFPT